ncbi:MAG: gatB [Microgenomates bacterium 39_6]|nr:MAG: gatB [Microgenomates bacterium 39_6]
MTKKQFFPVIGLEIHVELTTKRKMFCGCPADHFDKEPNTQTCPVCLGLPGALPVPNKEALRRTTLLALALKCQINKKTWFDRKNYFYPDLAKGYQISQFFRPLGIDGQVSLKEKTVNIKEVHLEEDTAKSLIKGNKRQLDFNKSGVPLIEIVSCPDLKSAEEAKNYAQKIYQIVRVLKISPANMEKGQMRLEANISLKKNPQDPLPNYKVEVKNINSFRYLYNAITYEIKRQKKLLLDNQKIVQETRGYNAKKKITYSQRTKEESYEYRYFPEPDIPPLNLSKLFNIKNLKDSLPELPEKTISNLVKQYQLSRYQADILVKKYPKRGEKTLALAKKNNLKANDVANAIINKDYPLNKMTPQDFIKKMKSTQKVELITGDKLEKIINLVIKENPEAVKDYQSGKKAAFGFLIGQVQQKAKGQADIAKTKQILNKILN